MRRVQGVVQDRKLTNCSRGIHNAWHFCFALVLVFKVLCCGLDVALFTP
nr:DUF3265 domain-containing protein [Vibrio navarrensis]